jgi:hypothetical protein
VGLFGNGFVPSPTLSSLAPIFVTRNTTSQVTLTGQYLTGASAVTISGTGVTVNSFTVSNDSTIVATIHTTGNATIGARTVSVTTANGTSGNVTLNVANPPLPTLGSISPNAGNRGTTLTVTLTGTSLSSVSNVTVSGTHVNTGAITVVDDSHLTVALTIAANAQAGARTVRVTNPAGNSNTVGFTVH